MKCRPFRYFAFVLLLTQVGGHTYAYKIISGNDKQRSNITFTFPIGATVSGDRFYLTACEPGAGKYTVSYLDTKKDICEGITPEYVIVNGEKDVQSPLFDQPIEHVALLGSTLGTLGSVMQRPVVSIRNRPDLHLIFDSGRSINRVLSVEEVKDAKGKTTAGIVELCSGGINVVFAAVKGQNEESFGAGDSGIALIGLTEDIPPGDYRKQELLMQTDAWHERFISSCASPFNSTMPMIRFKSGGNAVICDDAVSMHWDSVINRLFIATHVRSAHDEGSGARALAVGIPINGRLYFSLIASDDLFDGYHDKIVGVKGEGVCASIHQVNTVHYNGRSYVVVLGGSGHLAASKRNVFALPIVNGGARHEIGTLANVHATFQETEHEQTKDPIRAITQVAQTPDQVYTTSSIQAQVGGGPLGVGDIKQLFVHDAAVYVFVPCADEGKQAGLFVSHALPDANGVISGWTNWQRVSEFSSSVISVDIDVAQARYTWVESSEEGGTFVAQTQWSEGNAKRYHELVQEVNNTGGTDVYPLEHVSCISPEGTALHNTHLLACAGVNRVILAETARTMDEGSLCTELQYVEHKRCYTDGMVDEMPVPETSLIEFSGGVLERLGPIVSVDVAHDRYGQNGWLFVGGIHGLAVLAYPNGSGWNPRNNELGPGFTGLRPGMQFMPIGQYHFIRKVFHDNGFLYVLTDQYCDRIDLLHANIASGDVSDAAVRIADVTSDQFDSCSVLYDCIVSEKLCILATNSGLFRVGNGQDITQVSSADEVTWQSVKTSKLLPTTQLLPISATSLPQDVARDERGGLIYVLCSDRGCNRSCVYRLTIANTAGNHRITDETVVSHLAFRFKNIRNHFSINGACMVSARNQNLPHSCCLFGRNKYRQDNVIELDADATHITSIVHCAATGTWFIGGDFGLRVNE